MKDPERVLKEWAGDRITFDGGKGQKTLTRLNVERLIVAIVSNSPDARIGDVKGDERKGRMAKQIVYWHDARRLGEILKALYRPTISISKFLNYGELSPQFFSKFESLKELLQYFWDKSVEQA